MENQTKVSNGNLIIPFNPLIYYILTVKGHIHLLRSCLQLQGLIVKVKLSCHYQARDPVDQKRKYLLNQAD